MMQYQLYNFIVLILFCLFAQFTFSSDELHYPFERLFTNQEERQSLNNARKQFSSPEITVAEPSAPNAELAKSLENNSLNRGLRLSGVIVRSDGQQQIWLNGKRLKGNEVVAGEFEKKDANIQIKKNQQYFRLKVGQEWKDDKVIDAYQQQ